MFDTTSFKHAQANMDYDLQCVNAVINGDTASFFRVYQWQASGLTQARTRHVPSELQHIDHGSRMTGGGLVFHCPGDIVFAQAAPINSAWATRIKERYSQMATLISNSLNACDIPVQLTSTPSHNKRNIQFCATYHTPYECVLDGDKVAGIAVQKTRDLIVFQGVIHLQATLKFFHALHDDYIPYFSKGCAAYPEVPFNQFLKTLQDNYRTLLRA